MHPQDLYSAYSATYVERDLRQLVKVKELSKFGNFIRLLTGRAGQPVNLSFYRDKTGLEINLIREFQRRPYAIEIKAGTTFVPNWSVL